MTRVQPIRANPTRLSVPLRNHSCIHVNVLITDTRDIVKIDHEFPSYRHKSVLWQTGPDPFWRFFGNNVGIRQVEYTTICTDLYELQFTNGDANTLTFGINIERGMVFTHLLLQGLIVFNSIQF